MFMDVDFVVQEKGAGREAEGRGGAGERYGTGVGSVG